MNADELFLMVNYYLRNIIYFCTVDFLLNYYSLI